MDLGHSLFSLFLVHLLAIQMESFPIIIAIREKRGRRIKQMRRQIETFIKCL